MGGGGAGDSRSVGALSDGEVDPRFSYSVRGGFSLPQNDLRQTTGGFPNFTIGTHAERLIDGVHQLRTNAEYWRFSQGHQYSVEPTRTQQIDTKLSAFVLGGEYLFRIAGPEKRLSAGVGLFVARWSIDSVDTITYIPDGTAQNSGTSSWWRLGESYGATYRLTHKLELEGRWIHSHYGYEDIPVNNIIYGAGWRF